MKNLMMTTTAFMAVWSAMSGVGLAQTIVDDFSTGYDNASGNLIDYNNNDSDWSIVSAPSGVVLGPARVVNYGGWFNPDPNARWIVPRLQNGNTSLWAHPRASDYLFEYKFDLDKTASNIYLSAGLGVDNSISADGIQLNGNPLTFSLSSTSDPYHNFQRPFNLSFETENQTFFNEGENTLSIKVRNWGSVNNPIGLVIDGNVTATAVTPVPEPSALIGLLALGALGVTSGLSKKRQKKGENN